VRIQRKVERIKTHSSFQESLDFPEAGPREGSEAVPEETVVDQKEVGPLLDGGPNGHFTGVDSHGQALDMVRPLDLESVQGMRIVRKSLHVEGRFEKMEDGF
jgi:hypothetical protein